MGMELKEMQSDGSWIGANASSLAQPGDPPRTYQFCPEAEGAYLLYSAAANAGVSGGFGGQLSQGLFGSVTVQPRGAEWYRSQVTKDDLDFATYNAAALPANLKIAPQMDAGQQKTFSFAGQTYKLWTLTTGTGPNSFTTPVTQTNRNGDPVDQNGLLKTPDFHPIINYQATYPAGFQYPYGTPVPSGTPILAMLDKNNHLVHSDLTAIITGPNAGRFSKSDKDPVFLPNPTNPDRDQPYREFAIHYHDDFVANQAFPEFASTSYPVSYALTAARDFFAINYGMAAIGPEVWANRIKVGPMYQCDTCKFEEFFLSAWAVGDPAMVVDFPANSTDPNQGTQQSNYVVPGPKATKALFPDDPSNVYHSYVGDHVEFRILHAGSNITHVHHQHAHQWLHSPNSDESDYRDSQMISPGAGYTLDMSYFGSGNLNQTVGDSIFHCHFYPHFAQGMWSLWRVHDAFEQGTQLDQYGRPIRDWNRALPDGEIPNGTPIPALVPLPTMAMAPMPARTKICPVYSASDYVQFTGETCPTKPVGAAAPVGHKALVSKVDLDQKKDPGYPFYVPGVGGQRPPHPPLDYAPDEDDATGNQKVDGSGNKLYLDGGLPRNQALQELGSIYEHHNRWDFTKENDSLLAVELPEEGTGVEKLSMAFHGIRKHPTVTPEGQPGDFILNGQGPKPGAPYADPAVDIFGTALPNTNCEKHESGCLRYKAADIQMDVVLNKEGWHFPQQRMLSLWGDVKDNLENKRRPEPLFFRANSEKVIEYWHANLVPTNYELDDFQVRTPTDILGQHIHLVKFDVTSSDGAGNGFNYEDGTFSPEEVVDLIGHMNKAGGLYSTDASKQNQLKPKEIPYFAKELPGLFPGAQATIQRWYADPIYDCKKPIVPGKLPLPCVVDQDRTLRTVFTHDHFGPSTHQQVGLYAGLVIEPKDSAWFDSTTGEKLGTRFDGGPTTYQANIVQKDPAKSYREFLLEFQDRQLAYLPTSISSPLPYVRYAEPKTPGQGYWGWADPNNAINAPTGPDTNPGGAPTPHLITNQFGEGAYSLNYANEPLGYRLEPGSTLEQSDLGHVFRSIGRADPDLNIQPAAGKLINHASAFNQIEIDGAVVNGSVNWVINGFPMPNNSNIKIRPGDTITFAVQSGTHGITFLNVSQADIQKVFTFGTPQQPFSVQSQIGPNTWGTAGLAAGQVSNVLATLTVNGNIPANLTTINYECTIHQQNMAGSFTIDQSGNDAIQISGAIIGGHVAWVRDGVPLANNSTTVIRPGETITFGVQNGTHGITFLDKAVAESVFDFGPPGVPFQNQPTIGPDAWGTPGETSGTLATLKVKNGIPDQIRGVNFECTIHKQNMAGTLNLGFAYPPPQIGAGPTDPYTPLLRAYEGDNIQVRNLVGAHMGPHSFHLHGLSWQFEPSLPASGYRSTQGMSLSEHYELLFHMPVTSQTNQSDYLYASTSDTKGLEYGNWGLMRAYKNAQPDLVPFSASQNVAFSDRQRSHPWVPRLQPAQPERPRRRIT